MSRRRRHRRRRRRRCCCRRCRHRRFIHPASKPSQTRMNKRSHRLKFYFLNGSKQLRGRLQNWPRLKVHDLNCLGLRLGLNGPKVWNRLYILGLSVGLIEYNNKYQF